MTIEAIFIWGTLILLGLTILTMAALGSRSLMYGKTNVFTGVAVTIPVALLLVLGFTMETWGQAGIWTLLIMFVLACLAMLTTGIKGMFVSS